ncbi:hypothetical protein niasHT_016420 [Heterodera trifolii]|uniref:Uncharacterized protein n=1 Tax=Heterodera trifolii TaxID=157864 RepID=A0ABD2LLK8_9BILA
MQSLSPNRAESHLFAYLFLSILLFPWLNKTNPIHRSSSRSPLPIRLCATLWLHATTWPNGLSNGVNFVPQQQEAVPQAPQQCNPTVQTTATQAISQNSVSVPPAITAPNHQVQQNNNVQGSR